MGRCEASLTKGHVMLDTGAALTLVSAKWASNHGLKITEGKSLEVKGAGDSNIKVLGVTAFTIQLKPNMVLYGIHSNRSTIVSVPALVPGNEANT